MILTTTNSQENAEEIAKILVTDGLAACVQIDSVTSFFKWEGKVSNEEEYRLMIKANTHNYRQIEEIIVKTHTYTLPQIIQLDIDNSLPAYFNWVTST